jgi:hypothetical protein
VPGHTGAVGARAGPPLRTGQGWKHQQREQGDRATQQPSHRLDEKRLPVSRKRLLVEKKRHIEDEMTLLVDEERRLTDGKAASRDEEPLELHVVAVDGGVLPRAQVADLA